MLSRIGFALGMLLAFSVQALSPQSSWGQEIRWAPDVPAARKASMEYKVPVLIHFYGDNCLPCKVLEQNVLSRTEVIETLNKYFICVKVNASQDRQTAAEYGVHSWPTDVFISPDGKSLDQGTCKQTAAEYLSVLHGIAVMNRDRNVMLAAEQKNGASQVTSQVTNYAQPAAAAMGALASGTSPAIAPPPGAAPYAAGLPAAGLTPAGNPHGPNFYAQGAGTDMQQLPNSLAPNAGVISGPILSQNQPHAVTTAVQAAGNQIASASGQHALNTNDGHLPPMTFTAQVAPAQSGRASDPLAALVATAPSVPPLPAAVAPVINAWNQPQTAQAANGPGQTMDNPHFHPAPTAATQFTQNPSSQNAPAAASIPANPVAPALPAKLETPDATFMANLHSTAPALPNATAPALPATATLPPETSSQKVPASTVSFQPRNALSIEANTLGSHPQATALKPEQASIALEGYCPIALKTQATWIPGSPQFAVKHRGRIYHLSSQAAMSEFLKSPDSSSPVMSGYDAMIFLNEGKLVEGKIQYGLHDQRNGSILLFSSVESKTAYEQNFDRNTQALTIVLQNAGLAQ